MGEFTMRADSVDVEQIMRQIRARIREKRGVDYTEQQIHELVDRLAPSQLAALRGLLQVMLDPVSRAIANAPVDDEPETEQERQAVAEADEWLKHNQPIPFEDVLADFGVTLEDVKNFKDPE